jgi:hypothetical protein
MLNSEIHTPFALAAYLVPALPVQHLTPFATVAADPQDPHVSTGTVGALGPAALRQGLSFRPFSRRSSDCDGATAASAVRR